MSREKELIKNTGILAAGQFIPKIFYIITLPILTTCLTKEEFGTYDIITILVMLAIPIATLQIHSGAFRFLIECRGDYIKTASIITNIAVAVVCASIIVSILVQFIMNWLDVPTRICISTYFMFDTFYMALGQIVRGMGYNKLYSTAAFIYSLANMICVLIFVLVLGKGLMGVILSLVLPNIASFFYLFIKSNLIKYLHRDAIEYDVINKLLSYSWPMVPNNLSNWALKLSDRLVITAFLGVEANAVYAVANKIPNLLAMAQGVMVMAWQENASIAVNDGDSSQYYSKIFDRIFTLMIGFTAALIGFTPIIFKILIRGDYDESYVQMPLLILGMFFCCMSSFQGGIYIAHKRTKSVGITTMAAAGINLTIDFMLVNLIGITAGSVSTLAAYCFLYIYRMVDSAKFQPMDYHIKKQVLYFIFIAVMLVICFIRNYYLNILNIVLGITSFIILNKELIRAVIDKGKEMKKG